MGPDTSPSRKSGEHKIQAHSHDQVRKPRDVAHKASRHNIYILTLLHRIIISFVFLKILLMEKFPTFGCYQNSP